MEEAVWCRGLAQALEVAEGRLTRMLGRRRQAELGLEKGKHAGRTQGHHPDGGLGGTWL